MTTHHDELFGVDRGGVRIRLAVHVDRAYLERKAQALAAYFTDLEILPCRACDPASLPVAA
jgi:hypothetical protein